MAEYGNIIIENNSSTKDDTILAKLSKLLEGTPVNGDQYKDIKISVTSNTTKKI